MTSSFQPPFPTVSRIARDNARGSGPRGPFPRLLYHLLFGDLGQPSVYLQQDVYIMLFG